MIFLFVTRTLSLLSFRTLFSNLEALKLRNGLGKEDVSLKLQVESWLCIALWRAEKANGDIVMWKFWIFQACTPIILIIRDLCGTFRDMETSRKLRLVNVFQLWEVHLIFWPRAMQFIRSLSYLFAEEKATLRRKLNDLGTLRDAVASRRQVLKKRFFF